MSGSKTAPEMIRCAYVSRRTGQCMNRFRKRGHKRFCSQGCQVRAHQVKSGRHLQGAALRQAAIARDGGCVRCEPAEEEERDDTEQDPYEAWLNAEYPIKQQRLFVRVVDPTKPRTFENVETLCKKHFAQKSAEQHRERVGAAAFKAAKQSQGRQRYLIRRLRRSLNSYFGKHKWRNFEVESQLS